MATATLTEKLHFLASRRNENEATLLALALDEGVAALYREALIEAYLAGECSREEAVRELGSEVVEEVEFRRDATRRDVAWGLAGGHPSSATSWS